MRIISKQVVLGESPEFGLVLRNDIEISMNRPFLAVSWFSGAVGSQGLSIDRMKPLPFTTRKRTL